MQPPPAEARPQRSRRAAAAVRGRLLRRARLAGRRPVGPRRHPLRCASTAPCSASSLGLVRRVRDRRGPRTQHRRRRRPHRGAAALGLGRDHRRRSLRRPRRRLRRPPRWRGRSSSSARPALSIPIFGFVVVVLGLLGFKVGAAKRDSMIGIFGARAGMAPPSRSRLLLPEDRRHLGGDRRTHRGRRPRRLPARRAVADRSGDRRAAGLRRRR